MRSSHCAPSSPLLLFSPQSSWLSLLRTVLPSAKRIWSPCQRRAKGDSLQAVHLLSVLRRSPRCHPEFAGEASAQQEPIEGREVCAQFTSHVKGGAEVCVEQRLIDGAPDGC